MVVNNNTTNCKETTMKSMQSPFVKLRQQKGLSQGQFTLLLRCSKALLSDLERGLVEMSPRIKQALSDLGVDVDRFEEEHKAFVEHRREELRRQFMGKGDEKAK
jgi:transcriptional regulator with XRE-family HTH domain